MADSDVVVLEVVTVACDLTDVPRRGQRPNVPGAVLREDVRVRPFELTFLHHRRTFRLRTPWYHASIDLPKRSSIITITPIHLYGTAVQGRYTALLESPFPVVVSQPIATGKIRIQSCEPAEKMLRWRTAVGCASQSFSSNIEEKKTALLLQRCDRVSSLDGPKITDKSAPPINNHRKVPLQKYGKARCTIDVCDNEESTQTSDRKKILKSCSSQQRQTSLFPGCFGPLLLSIERQQRHQAVYGCVCA